MKNKDGRDCQSVSKWWAHELRDCNDSIIDGILSCPAQAVGTHTTRDWPYATWLLYLQIWVAFLPEFYLMWTLGITYVIPTIAIHLYQYFGHLKLMNIIFFSILVSPLLSYSFLIILGWCNYYRNNLSLRLNLALVENSRRLLCSNFLK